MPMYRQDKTGLKERHHTSNNKLGIDITLLNENLTLHLKAIPALPALHYPNREIDDQFRELVYPRTEDIHQQTCSGKLPSDQNDQALTRVDQYLYWNE